MPKSGISRSDTRLVDSVLKITKLLEIFTNFFLSVIKEKLFSFFSTTGLKTEIQPRKLFFYQTFSSLKNPINHSLNTSQNKMNKRLYNPLPPPSSPTKNTVHHPRTWRARRKLTRAAQFHSRASPRGALYFPEKRGSRS